MPTTFGVIYLGTGPQIDPTEGTILSGNSTSENAAALVGETYGSSGGPLYDNIQTFSPGSTGYSDGASDAYDTDNYTSLLEDEDTFSIDGGADHTFDAIVVYNATITYTDGTTASISAVVFQDTVGNLYLAPEVSSNTDQDALEAKAIESLELDSVSADTSNMTANRLDTNFVTPDGEVDGTAGDDTIGVGYVDAQGDEVDGADGINDTINAGAGADEVTGGSGDDTIDGGTGDDLISGNSGDDTIYGSDGADLLEGEGGADYLDGGDGDDRLIGYNASNAFGGSTIVSSDDGSSDTLIGGAGNDEIFAGLGDDLIDGGADDDTILAGAGDDNITGGTGNDTITGGDGDDTFVYTAGDGDDTITDFNTGNSGTLDDADSTNNDFIDLSGFYDHISELYADQADDGVLNQSDGSDYSNNSDFGTGSITFTGASADSSFFTMENTGVVCFTSGTAIRTPRGDVLIDDLKAGDLVTTMDNGPQPIRWIGRRTLDQSELKASPELRPVLIRKGSFGLERDLLVSPQHGILLDRDNLVRAKHLVEVPASRVRIAHGKRTVTYSHLMFDAHQIVFAENAPSESFYPGPMALSTLSNPALHELQSLFPEVINPLAPKSWTAKTYGDTARAFLLRKNVQTHFSCAKAFA